tara:strand:+ start:809 stop:1438 length:630 start_codon:yes stop_codon:yes gene_type:complete
MSFGYIGDTSTSVKQQVKNKGILTTQESFDLERQGFLGGSLELIQEQTVSGVSSVNFTNIKGAKFDVHFLQLLNISTSDDNEEIQIRFSNDSGSSYEASGYHSARDQGNASGSFNQLKSTSADAITIANAIGNATNEKGHSYCYLYSLNNSSKFSFTTTHSVLVNNTTVFNFDYGIGVYPVAETINAIQVLLDDSSNITGTIKLFGVKE